MSYRKSFKFKAFLCVFAITCGTITCELKTDLKAICESIRENNEKIILIGELKDDFLIITSSYHVLRILRESIFIQPAMMFMNHGRYHGQIEYAFPEFANNSYFAQVKSLIIGGRTVFVFKDEEYFEFDTFKNYSTHPSIRYNFNKPNNTQELLVQDKNPFIMTDEASMLSVNRNRFFYSFMYDSHKTPVMLMRQRKKDSVKDPYVTLDKRLSLILCYNPFEPREVYSLYADDPDKCSKDEILDFRFCNGFTSRGMAFVFCNDDVYVFQESVFWTLKKKHVFERTTINKFFYCSDAKREIGFGE